MDVSIERENRRRDVGLSPMQFRVFVGVLQGQTNKEIANHLHISEKTVKFHLTCIYKRLGVKNRGAMQTKFASIAATLTPVRKADELGTGVDGTTLPSLLPIGRRDS